ncbi:MAG: Holliday junction resolvase RuvX [Candidatus Zambryskibacteria bacterium CG10_big_fil_rev_8_21_14_0_10_34_34]|uniref:Putative pre-16S rRNA nuclease n=1 Tax=Candidatus Zambryskibacteria bacterium CG10_big_fil_rev_8_21_14_0_10_34_34 TaxID=1975114 RepID=A0A2H0R097_9BACT|nr:MAG: Holliday junction resolvase RuvX [Candidatus Zambryskibacteria bacterium CG10_big_fil_rev_8_21_14_0_10_34_34]
MKYLGIDFGSKRIGLAISDENGRLAFPYSVVSNDKNILTEIEKIIKNEKVDEVVMGESKDFKGEPNKIMTAIKKFKGEFEAKTKLKVWLEPEFMTSVQADRSIISRRSDTKSHQRSIKRQESKNEMLDASAATIILQSFLDKKGYMI